MSSKVLLHLFKPSLAVIILTGLLVSTMIIGLADRYGFTCGGDGHKCEGMGIQKPLLYGIPCFCWVIWVISSAPLLIESYVPPVTEFIQNSPHIESDAFGKYSIIGFTTNIIYYYVASCIALFIWRKRQGTISFERTPTVKS